MAWAEVQTIAGIIANDNWTDGCLNSRVAAWRMWASDQGMGRTVISRVDAACALAEADRAEGRPEWSDMAAAKLAGVYTPWDDRRVHLIEIPHSADYDRMDEYEKGIAAGRIQDTLEEQEYRAHVYLVDGADELTVNRNGATLRGPQERNRDLRIAAELAWECERAWHLDGKVRMSV